MSWPSTCQLTAKLGLAHLTINLDAVIALAHIDEFIVGNTVTIKNFYSYRLISHICRFVAIIEMLRYSFSAPTILDSLAT